MKKIKWGIVGFGNISNVIAKEIINSKNSILSSIATKNNNLNLDEIKKRLSFYVPNYSIEILEIILIVLKKILFNQLPLLLYQKYLQFNYNFFFMFDFFNNLHHHFETKYE